MVSGEVELARWSEVNGVVGSRGASLARTTAAEVPLVVADAQVGELSALVQKIAVLRVHLLHVAFDHGMPLLRGIGIT